MRRQSLGTEIEAKPAYSLTQRLGNVLIFTSSTHKNHDKAAAISVSGERRSAGVLVLHIETIVTELKITQTH